jgi:glycosyltransferase involved in cell wall biosynthesis
MASAAHLKVAYLVNQYPMTSHSFVRREIRALEALGVEVDRFSIRATQGSHVDASDAEEATRTTVLLRDKKRLALSTLKAAATHPIRMLAAAKQAMSYAWKSDRGFVNHAAYLAEACMLREQLGKRGIAHLHAHFGTNSAIVASLSRTMGGPSFSFTVHGPEEFDRAPVLGLADTIRASKFVVAISNHCRSQLCRQVELGQWNKLAIVRCGLDGSLLSREQPPIPSAPRLLCIGRLHEQKGHLVLLDAMAELKRRGIACDLVLAGDGPLRALLERKIADLGIADRIRVTGWLSEQQVVEELAATRAMVLPSFGEGLPVVIMEAMAMGRPVISTFIAGIPELVKPGENGWLVPAGSVPALVDAMTEALSAPPATLAEMGKRGQAAVRAQHDVAKSAAALAKLFAGEMPMP